MSKKSAQRYQDIDEPQYYTPGNDEDLGLKDEVILEKKGAPKDSFGIAYLILLLQGAGVLFGWNAFITAPDYFNKMYGEKTFFYFSLVYSYPNLIMVMLMVALGPKIPTMLKIVAGYVLTFVVLVAVPILGFANVSGNVGLYITFACVIGTAIATAILQGTVYGAAGTLPPKYMQACMTGNGVAGLVVSLLKILTKLTIERGSSDLSALKISSSVYFFVSAAVMLLCIITYFIFMRLPITKFYLAQASGNSESEALIKQDPESSEIVYADSINTEEPKKKSGIITIFLKIWHMCFLIFLTMLITLGVFPALTVVIPTSFPDSFMGEWFSIILITTYNFADLLGRSLPRFVILFKRETVFIPALLRLVIIPLFILMINPRVFNHDAISIAIMFFAAFSNGYISSLVMMHGPSYLENNEKEVGSVMMTFFLIFGIVMGSNLGSLLGFLIL